MPVLKKLKFYSLPIKNSSADCNQIPRINIFKNYYLWNFDRLLSYNNTIFALHSNYTAPYYLLPQKQWLTKSKNQKKAVCDDVKGWYFNICGGFFFCTASLFVAVKACAGGWTAGASTAFKKKKNHIFNKCQTDGFFHFATYSETTTAYP